MTLYKNGLAHVPNGGDVATQPTIYYPGDTESEANIHRLYGERPRTYNSYANNVLAYDMNRPAGTAYYHKPRGSWLIKQIYAIDNTGAKIVPRITDRDVYVKFEVTEPLLLSPFYIRARLRKARILWHPVNDFSDGHEWGQRKPSVAQRR